MGKLVNPELANVRTGDLAVRKASYLAGLEGDHVAPDLKLLVEALQHLPPRQRRRVRIGLWGRLLDRTGKESSTVNILSRASLSAKVAQSSASST
jgi:hypothetical protein